MKEKKVDAFVLDVFLCRWYSKSPIMSVAPSTMSTASAPAGPTSTPGLKLNYDVVILVRDFLRHALQFEQVKTSAPDDRITSVLEGMTQYVQHALTGPQNPEDTPDAAPAASESSAPPPASEQKQP